MNYLSIAPISLLWLIFCILFSGCSTVDEKPAIIDEERPIQAFRQSSRFPGDIQTVAVLPVTIPGGNNSGLMEDAQRKVQKFLPELVTDKGVFRGTFVTKETLELWSGRLFWSLDDALPRGFIENIANESGSQGILFTEVTEYQPYKYPSIGLRFHLIRASDGETVWQMDHLFEVGDTHLAFSDRKSGGLKKHFNLDKILGLPEGNPSFTGRPYFPTNLLIRESLRISFLTMPQR